MTAPFSKHAIAVAALGLALAAVPASGATSPDASPVAVSGSDVIPCQAPSLVATPVVPAQLVRSVSVSTKLESCVWVLTGMVLVLVDGTRCDLTPGPDGAWLGGCPVEMPRYRPAGDYGSGSDDDSKQVEYSPRERMPTPGASSDPRDPPPPECESSYRPAWVKTHSWTGAGSSWERVNNKMEFTYDSKACTGRLVGSFESGDCSSEFGFHKERCTPGLWNTQKGPHIWGHSEMQSNWNGFWNDHVTQAQSDATDQGGSWGYGGTCPIDGGLPDGAQHTCTSESGSG